MGPPPSSSVPRAGDAANAQNGAGRAYLIYGGNALNNVPNTTVDLDTIAGGTSGLSVVTFTTTIANAQTGRAVSGVGDFTGDGVLDIAIGAPTAAFPGSGLAAGGLVYLVSGAAIPTGTATLDLQTIGTGGPTATNGVVFAGELSGGLAGFAVAGAGNVAGQGGALTSDLLIGAPSGTGAGTAYLIYGGVNPPRSPRTPLPSSCSTGSASRMSPVRPSSGPRGAMRPGSRSARPAISTAMGSATS